MSNLIPKPEVPMFQIVTGVPDDNCEICRAHRITKDDPRFKEGMLVELITPHQAMECTCPLCAALIKAISPKGWGGL